MARILVIDDDEGVRTVVRLTLLELGNTVFEARNGKEGLALLEHTEADLLITDIVMPEKEGLEVLMELRKKRLPMKIIAMSGAGHEYGADYLKMAKLLGAAKALRKPFTAEVLVAAVNQLLPGVAGAPEQNLESVSVRDRQNRARW